MRFRHREPPPPAPPMLAFCETVWATATSKDHIRRVGNEGLRLGGGAPDTVLCGRKLRGGWDLRMEVTLGSVLMLAAARPSDGRVFLCETCAGEAEKILTGGGS